MNKASNPICGVLGSPIELFNKFTFNFSNIGPIERKEKKKKHYSINDFIK